MAHTQGRMNRDELHYAALDYDAARAAGLIAGIYAGEVRTERPASRLPMAMIPSVAVRCMASAGNYSRRSARASAPRI